jgi:hypothetical protein
MGATIPSRARLFRARRAMSPAESKCKNPPNPKPGGAAHVQGKSELYQRRWCTSARSIRWRFSFKSLSMPACFVASIA